MEKIKDTKNTCDPLTCWSFRITLLGKAKICVSSVIWRLLLSKNNNTCGRAVRDSHPDLIRIWNLWFVIIIPKKWKKFKCIEWAFDVKWRSRTVFFVQQTLCISCCLVGLKIITWKIQSYQGPVKGQSCSLVSVIGWQRISEVPPQWASSWSGRMHRGGAEGFPQPAPSVDIAGCLRGRCTS